MTEEEYLTKRYAYEVERDRLLRMHCKLAAGDRQRRIEKLDKDFINQKE